MRAFGLTQYDAVLLLDADTVVARDLGALWALPAPFAAVWDQSKWLSRYKTQARPRWARRAELGGPLPRAPARRCCCFCSPCPLPQGRAGLPTHPLSPPPNPQPQVQLINGGVFFLRPCPATEAHMVALLLRHPKLRFTHGAAEQDFFGCGRRVWVRGRGRREGARWCWRFALRCCLLAGSRALPLLPVCPPTRSVPCTPTRLVTRPHTAPHLPSPIRCTAAGTLGTLASPSPCSTTARLSSLWRAT